MTTTILPRWLLAGGLATALAVPLWCSSVCADEDSGPSPEAKQKAAAQRQEKQKTPPAGKEMAQRARQRSQAAFAGSLAGVKPLAARLMQLEREVAMLQREVRMLRMRAARDQGRPDWARRFGPPHRRGWYGRGGFARRDVGRGGYGWPAGPRGPFAGPPRRPDWRDSERAEGPPGRLDAARDQGPPRKRDAARDEGPPRRPDADRDQGPPRRPDADRDQGPPRRRDAARGEGPSRRPDAGANEGPRRPFGGMRGEGPPGRGPAGPGAPRGGFRGRGAQRPDIPALSPGDVGPDRRSGDPAKRRPAGDRPRDGDKDEAKSPPESNSDAD